MITRRHFLKISCGVATGAMVMAQQPLRTLAMSNQVAPAGTAAASEAVILMSAPSINNNYYRPFFDDLLTFYSRMVAAAHPNDVPLVMVDRATFWDAATVIPEENLIIGNIPDIWMRDFPPIRTQAGNFNMKYAPQYLNRRDARYIERRFDRWYRKTGLVRSNLPLILDGGNFNYNGIDRAVTTERILADNRRYSRTRLVNLIKKHMGIKQLAIIPEEAGDITGHSDGMVKWLAPNKLGVAQFHGAFRNRVHNALRSGLPGVDLVEIPYVPHDDLWQDWSTAKGVYVNALTTTNAIYVPMFGLAEDAQALAIYRQHATKPVIPVQVGPEVSMGGSVRCMTWQLDGTDAQTILGYYDDYDVYAAASAPEEVETISDEELDAEEAAIGELDSEIDRKAFSIYLPTVMR